MTSRSWLCSTSVNCYNYYFSTRVRSLCVQNFAGSCNPGYQLNYIQPSKEKEKKKEPQMVYEKNRYRTRYYMLQKNVCVIRYKCLLIQKKLQIIKILTHVNKKETCFSGCAPRFFSHAWDWDITRIYEGRLTSPKDPIREHLSTSG